MDRLLKFSQVAERVGFGRTAIYARIKRGEFPRPVKEGAASRWRESEVQAWIAGLSKDRIEHG